MDGSVGQPAVLQVNPKDALAMYGVRMHMPNAPMLRRAFHALVAMFQAAHNCDFYITKYHAKPMEQLQSLFTNIALGLRRLEAEGEAAQTNAEQPEDLPEERARKTVLKIANAANRSSWCSCCEMATFTKTGALVRKTHRPISIFLSRPLYLYEQCRRLLQRSHEILIEAQDPCDEHDRHVDVLCFTMFEQDRAVQQVDHHAAESDLAESVARDTRSHSEQAESVMSETNSAAQPDGKANNQSYNSLPISETVDDGAKAEPLEENLEISALETTTSPHDDWLHRGPFLFDMDFHTYIRFTVRKPRPKQLEIFDADRTDHVFLFDSHYALAASHWQHLDTHGRNKLVVMEALKCPQSSLNNGEDNAVFKSLIGTLLKCPGPGHCADPLFCKAGFFQVTVPESSTQTQASELPDWIDHQHFTRKRFLVLNGLTCHHLQLRANG
jgi:hypothetical protein